MKPTTLDEIEKRYRTKIKQSATAHAQHSKPLGFGLGFLMAPTVITGTLFIPILGLLLSVLLAGTSLIYFYLQRSVFLLLCWILGIVTSTLGFSALIVTSFDQSEIFIYVLVALSTTLLLVQNLFVAALVWNHFDRGAEHLDIELAHQNR